ncbi:MAG: endonuclease MutS2 [Bacillota bacterium]|nr:endonuclease MutS2 [Bacillota bacterium]HHU30236.1 endonuclease MutS2 [Bacillota bacterium]
MQREIKLLEFDKIRRLLADKCITSMAGELAEDLLPSSDLSLCRRWQMETTEAVSLLRRYQFSLENVSDIRRPLQLAGRGAVLGEEQLWQVLVLLNAVTKVKQIFREKETLPVLQKLAKQLNALPALREELRRVFGEEGRLRDDASSELSRITRSIASGERHLRERFDRFVKNPANQKILQENLVTMRQDRLVVPVRVEYRLQVPGVVHDQSASGATLFIEPLWAVEANNKLSALRREAEREKERILEALSRQVAEQAETIALNLNLYVELDFILAKGLLSLSYRGVEPVLNGTGHLEIKDGRHPLLKGEVVPITLAMGEGLRTLVITGPNTGGKTVTLKTVGLFAMMAQSGLHLPAGEGTQMAVFPRIFADIGDEQDISQSLSTFSGHLKNIVEIINNLEEGALVLLDEIGAGTDPAEGAGLAMAVLEYLHRHAAVTVATTHYSQLKSFAYVTPGMENASVEFDAVSLRPTYRLLVGVPGVSNAFAIAGRLGLAEEILERGKAFLSREEMRLEELVADLVADRKKMELASRQAEEERKQTQELLRTLQREKEDLEREKAAILEKAKKEALEIVSRARRESRLLLRELRKMAAQKEKPAAARIEELAGKMESLAEEAEALSPPAPPLKPLPPESIKPGMEVEVVSLGQRGSIVQAGGRQVQVQVGSMRINVSVDDLACVEEKKPKAKPVTALVTRCDVPREIDLRGLTIDEAILKVESYLDEALLASLKEVYLIHGKGTGRLRSGLNQYLRQHPRVASQRMGHPAEGGTGVTVIELK